MQDKGVLAILRLQWPLAALPVHEGAGARDTRQPLPDLARHLLRALRPREFQPQPPLDGGIAGADLDQKLGEPLRPERLEVLHVEGFLRCHVRSIPKPGVHEQGGSARRSFLLVPT
jgi:hypothetical protein